ncbi:MAG: hemD [Thermomicrobiales bacterium]|nr:hemD [Thermomicrobiales bacterium]
MTSRRPDSNRVLTFGTRGSALALAQAALAVDRFKAVHPDRDVDVRVIATQGDLDKHSPLTEIGGRGVFTNALEAAVLAGEVDAAVHSAKDLPTVLHPDAPIVAFPDRADPRDVLVSRSGVPLDQLPPDPVIGTSSRRRAVQIARLRPDARIVPLRGNIDTRLHKATEPGLDAIVLAGAGLDRMGWADCISQRFSITELLPSPGQGALAIQARAGSEAAALLEQIDDVAVSGPVGIERAFLGAIGAGCSLPVGALASGSVEGYRLQAMLADERGERIAYADEHLRAGDERAQAVEVAGRLKAEVEGKGRTRLWNGVSTSNQELAGARVVVTRPRRQARPLAAALRRLGAEPLLLSVVHIEPVADTTDLDVRLREVSGGVFDWLIFTSANAVTVCADRTAELGVTNGQLVDVSVAAIGPATAAAAEAAGWSVRLVAATATAEGLAAAMIESAEPGARVLYPRSAIGRDVLQRSLRAAGMDVVDVAVYETLPEAVIDRDVLEQVRRGEIDMITFSSPSAVRAFVELLGPDFAAVRDVPVVCTGPVTEQAARDAGFGEIAIGVDPGVAAMIDAVRELWRTQARARGRSSGPRLAVAAANEHLLERSGD